MTPNPLRLFAPNWLEPLDVRTQVDRFPPNDAPCECDEEPKCLYPFCAYPQPPLKEDE